jgi:hypothetical protein
MAQRILSIARNEKVANVAHWTVFTMGVISLTISVGATAVTAL